MSDPVTNVEIEDVLSSIRKLVSDGDKARTRDPAPAEPVVEEAVAEPEAAVEPTESKPEKLVLSPAFMVVSSQDDREIDAQDEQAAPEPLNLSNPVWEDEGEAEAGDETGDTDHEPVQGGPIGQELLNVPMGDMIREMANEDDTSDGETGETTSPDRSALVATITELEAAVSSDADEYEPDGSEDMGETIAWPGAMVRQPQDIEDAQPADDTDADVSEAATETMIEEAQDIEPPAFTHRKDAANDDAPEANEDAVAADVYEDDDLDDLLEAGGVTLDEAALRELVSDVVREELTGPMGERITRNVRKLVRREIYRILSSQEFD